MKELVYIFQLFKSESHIEYGQPNGMGQGPHQYKVSDYVPTDLLFIDEDHAKTVAKKLSEMISDHIVKRIVLR